MFSGNEFAIVAVVLLVLFGGSQLPKLARSLGQAQGELKKGLAEGSSADEDSAEETEEKA
ncbi:MAG: twin-arginine translocase TatA/TatE family subunit [Acidimicrobiales bacterium]